MASIDATVYTDPGCPFAYSAGPAFAVLDWRYQDALNWRIVTIGLADTGEEYEERGYSPTMMAKGYRRFRRYGMPFATEPRPRLAGTARACRAIVATRLQQPELELSVLRALQFGWFTTALVLDEDADIRTALLNVRGLRVDEIVAAIDDPEVVAAYEADRREARSAAGSPTEFQGKTRSPDGEVGYSAPSLVFRDAEGRTLEAGGFQPLEAYDVLIANFPDRPARRDAPEGPLDALRYFRSPLTTAEVAAIMTSGTDEPDRGAAEDTLIELAAEGAIERIPLGHDALWGIPEARLAHARAA